MKKLHFITEEVRSITKPDYSIITWVWQWTHLGKRYWKLSTAATELMKEHYWPN